MSADTTTLLEPAPGFPSAEVAAFMAGLEDQTSRLLGEVRGIGPAELAWQHAPGVNTIGMLLAHIAVAEAHITDVGLLGLENSRLQDTIGFGMEIDGMPLPPDALPPEALAGRELPFFEDLLRRARTHTREVAATLHDADLARQVVRQRADGTRRIFDVRWILYHLLEHEAGHRAQILLLRHLHRRA